MIECEREIEILVSDCNVIVHDYQYESMHPLRLPHHLTVTGRYLTAWNIHPKQRCARGVFPCDFVEHLNIVNDKLAIHGMEYDELGQRVSFLYLWDQTSGQTQEFGKFTNL